MKKMIPIFLMAIAPQAFSCINVGIGMVCVGDKVMKGSAYSQGATVVAENPYMGQVTVRSIYSGSLSIENVSDLDITNGCLGPVCTGSLVMKGTAYLQGARIEGINYSKQTLTVRSVKSGNLAIENMSDIELTQGCLENVCVGDLIYKGTAYSQGANIVSLNYNRRSVTVKSIYSGNLSTENVQDLDLTRGCVGNICVNDVVMKGTSYQQGARVLAVNVNTYRVTVKSNYSGNLASESVYDLQNTSSSRLPDPRDPQWPNPIPNDPRDPQWHNPIPNDPRDPQRPNPNDPAQPRRPGDNHGQDPRFPRNPAPVQVTEQCTVNRLDPAGTYITSYTRSVTGYPGADLKGEACRQAMNDCNSQIKGRQSCQYNP